MSRPYRGRLAPSPTGQLHLGHARTYLVAWLRARAAAGSIVMRMEDLDGPRVVPGAAEAIAGDLNWLGLDWDEGPAAGGPTGPYVQSERGDRYERALDALRAGGLTYPCTCSRKEIAAHASAPHGVRDLGVRYPGTCRDAPPRSDRAASTRFRMPEPPPSFEDGLHGRVDASAWGGDFVLRRADGTWSYQLAVVVDDSEMGITEVVRGDDLLPSTPRQIALFRALGRPVPRFYHLPLVLGPDGERLSKRHGAVAIADHREAGLRPTQIVGWLAATLGLAPRGAERTPGDLLTTFAGAELSLEATTADLLESLRGGS